MVRNIYGGDFLSDIKTFGRNLLTGINKGIPIAEKVLGVAGKVALLLLGLGEGCNGGDDDYDGGVLVGGKRIKRSKLRSRLHR